MNQDLSVVLPGPPTHTSAKFVDFGLTAEELQLLDPLPYLEFLNLQSRATVVLRIPEASRKKPPILAYPGIFSPFERTPSVRSRSLWAPTFSSA